MNSRALLGRSSRSRTLAWCALALLSATACGLTLDETAANEPGTDAGSSSGTAPSNSSSSGSSSSSSSSGAPASSSSSGGSSSSSSSSSSGDPGPSSSSSSGGSSSSSGAPEPVWRCANVESQTPYAPLALSGYNADVIAENLPIADATSRALDADDYVLFSDTFAHKGEPANYRAGMPTMLDVGERRFLLRPDAQLGAASPNNALVLSAQLPAESLLVSQPKPVSAVSVVWLATGGHKNVTVRLYFANGVHVDQPNVSVLDWVAPNGGGVGGSANFVAADKRGRVSRNAPSMDSALDVQGDVSMNVRLSGTTVLVPQERCGDKLTSVHFISSLNGPPGIPSSAQTKDTVAVFAISAVDSVAESP